MVKRRPWVGSSPRGWLSVTWPTPVMMPVNMGETSSERVFGGGAGSKALAAGRAHDQADVGANQAQVADLALPAAVQPGKWRQRGQRPSGPQQLGRKIHQDLVGPALFDQMTIQAGPGLDVQFVDAAASELGQEPGEIDLGPPGGDTTLPPCDAPPPGAGRGFQHLGP